MWYGRRRSKVRWLWVPAFAGKTADSSVEPIARGFRLRPALGGGAAKRCDLRRGVHLAVPALLERRRDAELVEHARDDVIDDVVDRLRMIVEGRQRRQHGHAHTGKLEHV